MTTIVIDSNYIISADKLSVLGQTLACSNNTVKVFRVEDDWIGGAGMVKEVRNFVEWYKGDKERKPNLDDCSILILKGKRVYSVEQTSDGNIHYIEEDVPTARGSGSQIALGAMLAGKSGKEAIEITSKVDVYTSSNVKEYNK